MLRFLKGLFYSFPIQLVFLHLRKYQALLIFWIVLFSTVNGGFMKTFGADSLYLAPEYMGNVNAIGAAIVGVALGMFIISWNIVTFILFSNHFRFLAATTNPFLKYCTNNSLIPLAFLIFYFFKAFDFLLHKEMVSLTEFYFIAGGFLSGFLIILLVSFFYFFRADRSIQFRMMPIIKHPEMYITHLANVKEVYVGGSLIKVKWYLDTPFSVKRTREVNHYTQDYVDSLFKKHHFSAVISVFVAFLFLIGIGYFLEYPFFQIPAAASITIFFAILIGAAGAISYFLQSWSVPYLIVLLLALNFLYKNNWIDPRNKAYGLNYSEEAVRPKYTKDYLAALSAAPNEEADKQNMISILNKWKQKQKKEKPLLVLINTSGGGHRSATFTMGVMQYLDSITNGKIMDNVFLISGASGGMIGASYFRELYLRKKQGEDIRLQDYQYVEDISGDLLNALFSSFVARDLIAPAQRFSVGPYTYVKDRGYAFEEKLNANTNGFLNKQLKDYIEVEKNAQVPLIFYNSVVTRDSRKMIISTQPVRFMMQNKMDSTQIGVSDPDAIDFVSFFKNQDPYNLRMLTAIRMNATFPIVLPNVWLPSDPVIDVMDAGLRDNYGMETSLRFIMSLWEEWIKQNTSGVVLLQIRDRAAGAWESPYLSDNMSDHLTRPFLLLQHNWFKMMEYFQNDMLNYYLDSEGNMPVYKIAFNYASSSEESKAALNFHLTKREEKDILNAVQSPPNKTSAEQLIKLLSGQ